MKKMLAIQITALLVISSALGGMLFFTDVYDEIHSRIVSVLCLSCIKLEPKTEVDFTFKTADNLPHPDFVLENLTKGPLFLHYSAEACHGCDIMDPIIKQLFDIDFEKDEVVYKTVNLQNSSVVYYYTNVDHDPEHMGDFRHIYELDPGLKSGVPLFVIVTLGYDRGDVKPYYTSIYGTLGLDTDEERLSFLTKLMQESIDIYNQNKDGYTINQE